MSDVVATAQQGLAGKYKQYPQYKDSGVEWLGDVPSSWSTCAIWMRFSIGRGRVISNEEIHKNQGDYPVYSSQTLNDGIMGSLDTYDFDGDYITWTTDGANAGTVFTRSGKFNCTNVCGTLRAIDSAKTNLRFYTYALSVATSWFVRHDINPKLMNNVMGAIKVPVVHEAEQHIIAAFLDYETARIDRLIAQQQRLIELLKEKRQTVISHAVTKGLNPDAPMKDSGVEWLGQVPEHWVVSDLSYTLSAIADIDHYMPESVDIGVPYLMTGDLKNFAHEIDFSECKQVSYVEYGKLSRKIQASIGDVIVARYATIGTATYVDIDKEFLVSYACVTVKPNLHKVAGLYLYYFIKSHSFLEGLLNKVNTNTQGNVGINDLKKVKISLPDVQEQGEVVLYLESITKKIDSLSRQAERAITLMNERRTALISAAVTGKIDLRGWTAPTDEVVA